MRFNQDIYQQILVNGFLNQPITVVYGFWASFCPCCLADETTVEHCYPHVNIYRGMILNRKSLEKYYLYDYHVYIYIYKDDFMSFPFMSRHEKDATLSTRFRFRRVKAPVRLLRIHHRGAGLWGPNPLEQWLLELC